MSSTRKNVSSTLTQYMKERNIKSYFDMTEKERKKVSNPFVWGSAQYYELYAIYKELQRGIKDHIETEDKNVHVRNLIQYFIELGIIQGEADFGPMNTKQKAFQKLIEYAKKAYEQDRKYGRTEYDKAITKQEYESVVTEKSQSISRIFHHMNQRAEDLWMASDIIFRWVFPKKKWELRHEDSMIGAALYIFILKYLGLIQLKYVKDFDT
jgi:hypothetical protein